MITLQPIGIIHSPFAETEGMPIQSARSKHPGQVELFPEYSDGLDGLADFSHIYLIYCLHKSPSTINLKVKPFLDDQVHGVFATRYPNRPNPIGLSIVRVCQIDGNVITFEGADMLDGTPLLDIKPYITEFDVFEVQKSGWYTHRKYA